MRNKLLTALGVIIFIGFVYIGVHNIRSTNNKIKFKEIEVKSQEIKLKQLDERYQEVLDKKANTEAEKADQAEKIKQLEEEKKKLQEQLTLKLERQKQAELAKAKLSKEAKQVARTGTANASTGDCASWIASAGITEISSATELIRRESGCNPYARNKSSNACGVAQELPCGKSGCKLGDGACQVKWMNSYVIQRYSTWENAISHHNRNNWY